MGTYVNKWGQTVHDPLKDARDQAEGQGVVQKKDLDALVGIVNTVRALDRRVDGLEERFQDLKGQIEAIISRISRPVGRPPKDRDTAEAGA